MNPLQRLLAWIRGIFATGGSRVRGRTTGRPTSANGASSLHLRWIVPPGTYVAASVELAVDWVPPVSELYFWALQASFRDASSELGGAHLGLQWNPRFPARRAVNWGGYADARRGGGILDGTASALASTPGDPNTRDYSWQPATRYRLTIEKTPGRPGWWRGSVTDVATGETSVVRDLHGGGDRLAGFMVWSEVFARCDHPMVVARWSKLQVVTSDGTSHPVETATVNYQSHAAGGCANTDVSVERDAFAQATSTARLTPQDATLTLA